VKKLVISLAALVFVAAVVATGYYLLSNLNSFVAGAIETHGSEVTDTEVGVTGVVGVLRGGRPGATVAHLALYLAQHGEALAEDVDPERSLSPEGTADVERIAGVAKNYSVPVSRIEHSGKKRAAQTAEIFAAALEPPGGVKPRAGINPMDDVVPVAEQVRADDDLMLIGHLPFMEKLLCYLVTGSSDRRLFKFQNGGIVCLDQDPEEQSWFIKWALMPEID